MLGALPWEQEHPVCREEGRQILGKHAREAGFQRLCPSVKLRQRQAVSTRSACDLRPDKIFGRSRTDGEWAVPRLEIAEQWDVPTEQLLAWSKKNRLEVVFFFQNEQFEAISALRRQGVV